MHEGFQPARAIAHILKDIEHQQLVLPAIQREFVWSDAKICSLFDSLMRAYPIGGFLFWRDDYFEPRAGFRRLGEVLSAIGGAGLAIVRFEELPTLSPWRRQDPRVPAAFVLLAEKPERPQA